MKILFVTLVSAAIAFSQTAGPAPQPQPKQKEARLQLLKKFQADLDTASARANFSEQQRQEFASAREALRKQGERHRRTGQTDREPVRQAMRTLRGLSASDALQPGDRETLKRDLRELRKASRHRTDKSAGRRKTAA